MSFDIDSREFAEIENRPDPLPRADARYGAKLKNLEEVEADAWAGWVATVEILSVEPGKTHECMDPLAVEGRPYRIYFKRIGHRFPEQKAKDMSALRMLTAAACGQEHTPDLKVGPLLAALTAEDADYDATKTFTAVARCSPSKPAKALKADGTENPNAGKIYPNLTIAFE